MPVLDKLTGNGQPQSEDDGEKRRSRPRRPEIEIIPGRPGYANFSLAALRERIEAQVQEELEARPDILLDTQDESARRGLVREAGEYVLAVEAVSLDRAERMRLFDEAYSNLFSFGPLDAFLADDTVTDLVIDGHGAIQVRRWMGGLEAVPSHFEDAAHLARIMERIVSAAGAQFLEAEPFLEVGLTLLGRPARLACVLPPLSPVLHVDVRLHPKASATLDYLRAVQAISEVDRTVLRSLAQSAHGFLVIGEGASGKTSLLQALVPEMSDPASAVLVERAAELRAEAVGRRLAAQPATADQPGVSFSTQITAALEAAPRTLIVDELRGDESGPIWQALTCAAPLRCVGVLRCSPEPDRLRSAISVLLRKGQPAIPQAAIHEALLVRLPFVVMTRVGPDGLHVTGIAEWEATPEDGLALRKLVSGGILTGVVPEHDLPLEPGFWGA